MCITQVTSFRVGDKLYDNEIEAVEAALKSIAAKLLRDHPSDMYSGLLKYGEEIGVLIDRKRMLAPRGTATTEAFQEAVPPSVPPSQGSSARGGGVVSNIVIGDHDATQASLRRRLQAQELDFARNVSPHSSDRLGG